MYWRANSVSIIAARVAGVPIPASFRLAFSSASSSSPFRRSPLPPTGCFPCAAVSAWSAFPTVPRWKSGKYFPLEWRQAGGFFIPARFLLAEHGTPPGFFHHRPFHREVGISSRQHGGGNVFHALARKGFQHTPGYQLVNRPLVFGKFAGQVLGND